MRILLIHRYFWPDTPPYASILYEIARQLVKDGHEVEVLSTLPSYKSGSLTQKTPKSELVDGFTIKRLSLFPERRFRKIGKLLNFIYFPLAVAFDILTRKKRAVVMCSTAPPVLLGAFSAFASNIKKSKFIYHCMDIHPEIGRLSGEFSNPFLFKALLKLDQFTCKSAYKTIVLSNDMKNALVARDINNPIDNIEVINNFAIQVIGDVNQSKKESLPNFEGAKFKILFAGNIGRFQGLESFVDAMALIKENDDIELIFMGEGTALPQLKTKVNEMNLSNVSFVPHQTVDMARQCMMMSDLGIVSLTKGIYQYAFPSKTITYMATASPLLVVIEPESNLAESVKKNDLGYTALPNDPQSIATAVLDAYKSKNSLDTEAITEYFDNNFSTNKILEKWSSLINKVDIG